MKDKVLVVIDMQNDFITGSLGSPAAQSIVPIVCEKIDKARKDPNTLIVVTRDTHSERYLETLEGIKLPVKHCIEDTEGWNLNSEVADHLGSFVENDYVGLIKDTFGANDIGDVIRYNANLSYWQEISEIEVCGLCTDICVISNVAILRAAFPNAIIKVDSKACAGTSIEAHEAALTVMRSIQVDVI